MLNPETSKITNNYESQYKDDLIDQIIKIPRYKRDKVKFYICDMNKTYIEVGKLLFRNAKIVIDKFHYTQLMTRDVDNIRKRIQKKHQQRKENILKTHVLFLLNEDQN